MQLQLHTVVNCKTWIYFDIFAWSIAILRPNVKLFEIFFNKEELFNIINVEMNKALKKNIELPLLRSAMSLHTNHFLWRTMTTLSIDVTKSTNSSWIQSSAKNGQFYFYPRLKFIRTINYVTYHCMVTKKFTSAA